MHAAEHHDRLATIDGSSNIVAAGTVSGIVNKDGHIGFTIEIDPKDKNIMFLCKLLGKYVLYVHNLRTKNGGDLSEKPGGGKPSLRTGSKGGPAQGKRPKCANSQSKKNLKKITDFLKSNNVTNTDLLEQLGMTRGQTRALENLSWN